MTDSPSGPNRDSLQWTPARMLSRLDGDVELAQQLAAIFVDEYPQMLDRLRAALTSGMQ